MPRACSRFLGPFCSGEVARATIKKWWKKKKELFSEIPDILFYLLFLLFTNLARELNISKLIIDEVETVSSILVPQMLPQPLPHCHFVILFLQLRAKFDLAPPGNLI